MDREANLERLQGGQFDLLVIGGGATGTGIAVDAALRGISVALVERDDFSAGTSSRSTKLIHGGVRYLEQAVKRFDRTQFNLVRDALHERATLLRIAPHLAQPLPLVTPLYNWLEVPYYLTGLKLYDWLAGKANIRPSTFIDAREAMHRFPMLRAEGLRGGVVYFDGQFDDSRMNVSLAMTAAEAGAVVVNHAEVTGFERNDGKLSAAHVEDRLGGGKFEVAATVVVNATGPFTDRLRRLADEDVPPMLSASSGAHIVLDDRFSPPGTGLLIPETEDGRVLFLLPWQGHTLVGTTDNPAEPTETPKATEEEIEYILRHVRQYFSVPVERGDVLSSWSGLRPLVSDPGASDTARLSRDHVINVSDSGLITIAGGKWTTYRKMAADAVDEVQKRAQVGSSQRSITDSNPLVGGGDFQVSAAGELQERYGLDADVASHLNRSYGDRAPRVAQLAVEGFGERLSARHPYLQAEVLYAGRAEMARTSVDVISRRTRLGFLDRKAAIEAVPVVSAILQRELGWSDEQARRDRADAAADLV